MKITPLHIEIMINYKRFSSDFRKGDFSDPEVPVCINELVECGLLTKTTETGKHRMLGITRKGDAWVDALCQVPLPIQKWVMA